MTEQKSPLEQALDLMLYAPVGLAITARDELPRFVEKGRQQVATQLAVARMIGQFAFAQGQREMAKAAKQAGDALAGLGLLGDVATKPRRAAAPSRAPQASTAGGAAVVGSDGAEVGGGAAGAAASNGKGATASGEAEPSSDGLAIPGYDSLSASQVVQRLAGLAPGELEAVRGYEATTRGRRTILSRISQLQTEAG